MGRVVSCLTSSFRRGCSLDCLPSTEYQLIAIAKSLCVGINGGSSSVPLAGVNQLCKGSYGWVARLFSEVRGRDGQGFNRDSILPLLVSRILLNHRGVFCVPACSTKVVVER